jgi:hypothetical protein
MCGGVGVEARGRAAPGNSYSALQCAWPNFVFTAGWRENESGLSRRSREKEQNRLEAVAGYEFLLTFANYGNSRVLSRQFEIELSARGIVLQPDDGIFG